MNNNEMIKPIIYKPFEILGDEEENLKSIILKKESIKPFVYHKEEADLIDGNIFNIPIGFGKNKFTEEADVSEVSNYKILPVEKIIYVNRFGKIIHEREKIRSRIWIYGREKEEIEILTNEIHNIVKIIGNRYAEAIVDYTVPKVEKIIESAFRAKIQGVKTTICYVEHGWQMIHGKRVYVCDDGEAQLHGLVETGLKLPKYPYTYEQAGNAFLYAVKLYDDMKSISTMLLFSLLGVSYRIFFEAGYAPHFLLFLSGKTGSMKTTIGKILFVQLADDAHRDYPRRIDADTVVSFERGIITKGRDTITLIDDYAPAKTTQKKIELNNKLESIIRMVGDGSTKSRSNQNLADIQGEGVQGGVVLTGELRGKGMSSNLRCMYCNMQREYVNSDVVSWFQENPFAYTSFIALYSNYLSDNWNKLKTHIKIQFPLGRKNISEQLKEKRLVDSAVVLHILSDFLKDFLISYCKCNEYEISALINNMKSSVVDNAKSSEILSIEENPAIDYIKAIDSLMCVGDIVIYDKNEYVGNVTLDGFKDEKFYYFVPERVYEKVKKLYRATGKYLSMDLNEITTMLYEEKIIKSYKNGVNKKTYYARISLGNGKKQSFLKISNEIFKAVVEEDFNNEVK